MYIEVNSALFLGHLHLPCDLNYVSFNKTAIQRQQSYQV